MYLVKITCPRCNQKNSFFVSSNIVSRSYCSKCNTLLAEIEQLQGFVYILSNPSMPSLVKIGLTTMTVTDRVAELNSATGVPTPFVIEAYFASQDSSNDERIIHTNLASLRVQGREFFKCSVEKAIEIAISVLGRQPIFSSVKGNSNWQKPKISYRETLKEKVKLFMQSSNEELLMECPFCKVKVKSQKLIQHCDSQHSHLYSSR